MNNTFKAAIAAFCLGFVSSAQAGPFEDGVAAYQHGDYTAAIQLLKPLADQGIARAQFAIGVAYYLGQGVQKNYPEALHWFRKAADQGNGDAQYNLGEFYAAGLGVRPNFSEAASWYRKAADQGVADAQCDLGNLYAEGRGVAKDDAAAVGWFRKAADQGNARAQWRLGTMYTIGHGVPKDAAEASKWYRLSADQGLASAQFDLGYMYAAGDGVPPNFPEAAKWLRKAADQNYPEAQTVLDVLKKAIQDANYKLALGSPKAEPNPPARVKQGSNAGSATTQMVQSNSAVILAADDLPKIAKTYRENEMRFKRDFFGKQFSGVLPFMSAKESMFSEGTYSVGFGTGNFSSDIDCNVKSPAEIAEIANWNKGDKIRIGGVVKDVTMGTVVLEPCTLSK
jgi:TPR repeat protein